MINYQQALKLWAELEDVPINENEEIDIQWIHFPKGTDRQDIWRWFEEEFNLSVGKDLC